MSYFIYNATHHRLLKKCILNHSKRICFIHNREEEKNYNRRKGNDGFNNGKE